MVEVSPYFGFNASFQQHGVTILTLICVLEAVAESVWPEGPGLLVKWLKSRIGSHLREASVGDL